MSTTTMNSEFKPMDIEPETSSKAWCKPLLIASIAWLAVSLTTPFATFFKIACILYMLVPTALIVYSVVKRKKYKVLLPTIFNFLSLGFNGMILFTYLTKAFYSVQSW